MFVFSIFLTEDINSDKCFFVCLFFWVSTLLQGTQGVGKSRAHGYLLF